LRLVYFFFFFSSRRRHTRSTRDWSSDVCSSDLCLERHCIMDRRTLRMTSSREYPERPMVGIGGVIIDQGRTLLIRRGSEPLRGRSEERRVGKECRTWRARYG